MFTLILRRIKGSFQQLFKNPYLSVFIPNGALHCRISKNLSPCTSRSWNQFVWCVRISQVGRWKVHSFRFLSWGTQICLGEYDEIRHKDFYLEAMKSMQCLVLHVRNGNHNMDLWIHNGTVLRILSSFHQNPLKFSLCKISFCFSSFYTVMIICQYWVKCVHILLSVWQGYFFSIKPNQCLF